MGFCFHCKKELPVSSPISRRESCPFCESHLHCCKNCDFYDEKSYNECRESSAERILDKEKANFCDYFSFSKKTTKQADENKKSALDQLNSLFKS